MSTDQEPKPAVDQVAAKRVNPQLRDRLREIRERHSPQFMLALEVVALRQLMVSKGIVTEEEVVAAIVGTQATHIQGGGRL